MTITRPKLKSDAGTSKQTMYKDDNLEIGITTGGLYSPLYSHYDPIKYIIMKQCKQGRTFNEIYHHLVHGLRMLPDSEETASLIKKYIGVDFWTVYKHPTDYPDKFVARKFLNDMPTEEVIVADNYAQLKKQLPHHLTRLLRHPLDDPKIIEIWM